MHDYTDNAVKLKNLSFSYDGSQANIFTDLNLDVEGGDFVCLLGESGCGKSTLLRLIAGLERPQSGEILIGNEKHMGAGLDKAVVFQDYGLFPWMTAGENIKLALKQKFKNKTNIELENIAKDMLSKVGLSESVYSKLPKELSGGMKQRCAIARAFAIDSQILLMDEPFGALDAVTRSILQELVLDLWTNGEYKKTVFFVTHDVEEALILAKRIVVLGQNGEVIYDTPVSEEQRVIRGERDSEATFTLRNELVYQINKDVTTITK